MDEATQQNSALVEEAAAAANSMMEQASALAGLVSIFRLDVSQGALGGHGARAMSIAHTSTNAIALLR